MDVLMEELTAYRADLLIALENVMDELAAVVATLPAELWHQPVLPGDISPHYVLYRLYVLEAEQFFAQLPRFQDSQKIFLPAFEEQTWMATHYHPDKPAANLLEQLRALHRKELTWLHSLPAGGWSRLARHPWWGEHTLQWWVELQLEVSVLHLEQLRGVSAPDN